MNIKDYFLNRAEGGVSKRFIRVCFTVARAYDFYSGAVQLAPCKAHVDDAVSFLRLATGPRYPFRGYASMCRCAVGLLRAVSE